MSGPRVVALCAVFAAAACGGAPDGPDPVIARFDDRSILLSEFELYLEDNLADDADREMATEELDLVRSRLLDHFVEERMLLEEATRRGVWVSDLEIASYLGPPEEQREWSAEELDRRKARARDRLKIQKLEESVALDQTPAREQEIVAYIDQNADRLRPGRRVELRSLRFASAEEAAKVDRDLRKGRFTFNEAVVAHRSDPGQGLPLTVDWDGLAEEVRAALEKLRVGQVTPPLEWNAETYLFQLVRWVEPEQRTDELVLERARRELQAQRRREAFARLLSEVRAGNPVRIEISSLPFAYSAPDEP